MRQLTIEPAGYLVLQNFQRELEGELVTTLLPVQGWAGKLAGQLVRIAALYQLAADPMATSISCENIKAAIALAPYLKEHALKALSAAAADQPAHKVITYLVSRAESLEPQEEDSVGSVGAIPSYQFTTRQLQQHFNKASWLAHSEQPAMTLRAILTELVKDYWLQLVPIESTGKGGRPSELWQLNPQAVSYFAQLYG